MIAKSKDRIYKVAEKYGNAVGLDLTYFVKNGFWVLLRQIIASLCGLSVSVAFARIASKEILGQYQLALSIISVVSIFSIPGLNVAVMRSIARGNDGDYKKAVKLSFLWSLLGVPALFLVGAYYFLQNQTLGVSLMLGAVFFPFLYSPNTWDYFFQGKGRFDLSTKYFSFLSVFNSLFIILAVFFFKNNLKVIFSSYLISYSLFNSLYFLKSLKFVSNSAEDPEMAKYGVFLTKMKVLELIANNIDKILLATFLSPAALASYHIISLLPVKAKNIFKPFGNILFPKMAQAKQPLAVILKEKRKILYVMAGFLVVLAVLFYFLVVPVNKLFFGAKYADAYALSRYYVVLVLIFIPLNLLGRYVQAVRNYRILVLTNAIYPVIQILIDFALILKFGILGAVLAYNINTAIWLLIYMYGLFLSRKTSRG
jgi:O-antigen/teichoic acid export membrane protein